MSHNNKSQTGNTVNECVKNIRAHIHRCSRDVQFKFFAIKTVFAKNEAKICHIHLIQGTGYTVETKERLIWWTLDIHTFIHSFSVTLISSRIIFQCPYADFEKSNCESKTQEREVVENYRLPIEQQITKPFKKIFPIPFWPLMEKKKSEISKFDIVTNRAFKSPSCDFRLRNCPKPVKSLWCHLVD